MGPPHRTRRRPCGDPRPPDLGTGRARALKGATLALICERPGYGYDLANRLKERLGPSWRVTSKELYPILDQLTRLGLVTPVDRPSGGRPRQRTVVYHPTDRAPVALARWKAGPVRKEPLRSDVRARVAVAVPDDVPELLRLLDQYEVEILCLIEATHDDIPPRVRSWAALQASITREGTDAHLKAEIAWVVDTRRRLREWLAEQG